MTQPSSDATHALLRVEHDGDITHIRLNRPAKRNAISDSLIALLHMTFINLPESTRAVVVSGEGDHFCAGLDLAEVSERTVAEGILHSRSWHAAFEAVQFGRVPVISVLHGAVVGGGLEFASATHIRVAETSAFYGLPEGQRGLFDGGGGSARIPRLIGVASMTDLMMTGRVLDAHEGQQLGISQYLVEPGQGLAKAFELARRVAANAPLSNFAVMHALPRIADASQSDGLFIESLMAAIAQGDEAAKLRVRAFLEGRAAKVRKSMSAAAPLPRQPHRYRDAHVGGCLDVEIESRADGSRVLRSREALQPYPDRLTDRLAEWAAAAPDRVFVAKRTQGGDWRTITYADMLDRARRVGHWLLQRGLSVDRPIAILSDNDLEHLTLALAAMWVGIPFAPISSAYSLMSGDFAKLRHILATLTPGLVFASGPEYARAIEAVVPPDVEVLLTHGSISTRATTRFDATLESAPGSEVEAAHAATGPETIVKFLFTSGSTKDPKGVVNTHRMMCANQQMLRQCLAFLADDPPVLVDWLPWNHTFGGNHNVGITLYNGGTLYIDDGKPTPKGIGETLRNLREISPTIYFNVPKGYEEIAAAMEDDPVLRESLFRRVKAFMFAGAGLSQSTWDRLDRHAYETVGECVRMITSLGMTETAPCCTFALGPT